MRGAAVDEQLKLRPAFPLVRGNGDRRGSVEPRSVQHGSRAVAESRFGPEILRPGERAGDGADFGQALLGGWHTDRGLGAAKRPRRNGDDETMGGGDSHGEPSRKPRARIPNEPESTTL